MVNLCRVIPNIINLALQAFLPGTSLERKCGGVFAFIFSHNFDWILIFLFEELSINSIDVAGLIISTFAMIVMRLGPLYTCRMPPRT